MKVFFAVAVTLLAGAPQGQPSAYVLCYHAFNGRNNEYTFTTDELEAHCSALKGAGYRFISSEEFFRGDYRGQKNVLITVDDGNKSVYEAYYRVFKRYGIKPLLAIYPAIIGKTDYALSWEELKELAGDGCSIASHGYNHLYVNDKLLATDPKSFNREIRLSQKRLQDRLGREVNIFVYPFGLYGPATLRALRESGYRYGFTIKPGITGRDDLTRAPFEIRRYMMTEASAPRILARMDSSIRIPGKASVSENAQKPVKREQLKSDKTHRVYKRAKLKAMIEPGYEYKLSADEARKGPVVTEVEGYTPFFRINAGSAEPAGVVSGGVSARADILPAGTVEAAAVGSRHGDHVPVSDADGAAEAKMSSVESESSPVKDLYLKTVSEAAVFYSSMLRLSARKMPEFE